MGTRTIEKVRRLGRRGNRKRLRSLLRKHPMLKTSNHALLIDTAILDNRTTLPWLLEQSVSPDCRGGGDLENTPLMNAAADGETDQQNY